MSSSFFPEPDHAHATATETCTASSASASASAPSAPAVPVQHAMASPPPLQQPLQQPQPAQPAPPTHDSNQRVPSPSRFTATSGHADEPTLRLKELFPNVDPEVAAVVLHENGGDVDKTINQLLQLTDPSFVPEAQPHAPSTVGDNSSFRAAQLLQDEEYAARLQQEEEYSAQQATHEAYYRDQQQQQQQQEVPLKEQFTALADSAKSKFNALVDLLKPKQSQDDRRPVSSEARGPQYSTLLDNDDSVLGPDGRNNSLMHPTLSESTEDAPLERRQRPRRPADQ